MSKRAAWLSLAASAALLTATMASTPAGAATTWTVQPGGNITVTFGMLTLTGTRNGQVAFVCTTTGGKATGSLSSGSNPIGHISSFTFPAAYPESTNCEGPLSTYYILKMGDLPYPVNALSFSSGTTQLSITGVHGTLEGGLGCLVTFDGSGPSADDGVLGAKYTNGSATLSLIKDRTTLHAYKVQGCSGLIKDGDSFTLTGTGTVSPAQTITQGSAASNAQSGRTPR
jgi:hypothetical protein